MVLSATTTAIDNTTVSGYGSTSEFSTVLAAEVVVAAAAGSPTGAAGAGGELAKTGQSISSILFGGAALISAALATALVRRKYVYRLGSR